MGCLSCLAGCLLVLVNVIFLLLGLVLAGAGGVMKWGGNILMGQIEPILKNLASAIPNNSGIDKKEMFNFIDEALMVLNLISVPLLIIGIFFFTIAILGMCGVCCQSKWLLIGYIVVTGIILAAFLGFFIWFTASRGSLETTLTNSMTDSIRHSYKGLGHFNFVTLLWDIVNNYFQCCGVTNGTDFVKAPLWNRTYSYTYKGYTKEMNLTYPLTCCKMKQMKPVSINCTWDPTIMNSNHKVGCWSKVSHLFDMLASYGTGIAGAILAILTLLVVSAALVLASLKKSSVRPV